VRACRFDVETKVTSFGNPEWEKTHEKAVKTASVLEALKEGGAMCIGKTVMDDLGFRYERQSCHALSGR
jgi:amidase